ncbi:MAG: diguanylate cyclase [Actinobacteria bacterium]|nr:diguanylate cyclase [Actinomycetota bacterium]
MLFLTARTSGGEAARGLSLGAHDYLKKPCDQAELLARVGAALRQRAREQGLASRAQELADLSTTDALTGVRNRRGLEQLLGTMARERDLGVVIIDLDHFKQVNDTEGHIAGDAVLAVVAARLRAACGSEATVTRWGGEEFVALAPDCTAGALSDLAERLRSSVASTPVAVGGPRPLAVTVSIGTAVGSAGSFPALLDAADAALYEAKSAGRDRVVSAAVDP